MKLIQHKGLSKAVEVFQSLVDAEKRSLLQTSTGETPMDMLASQLRHAPVCSSGACTDNWALANTMQIKAAGAPASPLSLLSFTHKSRGNSTLRADPEEEGGEEGEEASSGDEATGETAEGMEPAKEGEDNKALSDAMGEGDAETAEGEEEEEEGLQSMPDPAKDNVWLISTQTAYGIVNLYSFVQLMWALIAGMAMVATIFEYVHLNYMGFDWDQPLPPVPGDVAKVWRNMCVGYVWVCKIYLWNPDSDSSRGLKYGSMVLFLMVLEAILDTGGTLMLNCWTTAMFATNFKKVFLIIGIQLVNVIAKVFATSYRTYILSVIKFEWREALSMYMAERWLQAHTHYYMHLSSNNKFHRIDNPEQRIQEDCRTVVSQTIEIGENVLRALLTLSMQVPLILHLSPPHVMGIPWLSIPGWPLWMGIMWVVWGGLTTQLFSSVLVGINWLKEREEAYFRLRLGHVKRYSETIAVCGNEEDEIENVRDQYLKLKFCLWKNALWTKRLTWWWQVYKDCEGKACFILFLPSFMAGEVSFGTLVQCAVVLIQCVESLDLFTNNYYTFVGTWRASTDRILEFLRVLDEIEGVGETAAGLHRKGEPLRDGNFCLKADFDIITTPAKEIVWKDLHIEVPTGQRLLISGTDQSGKSSIFKSLSGVWPYFDGGRVVLAAWLEKVMFMPEQVCLPEMCSLRAALAYPESTKTYNTQDMEDVLKATGLERLLTPNFYNSQPRSLEEFDDNESGCKNHHVLEHEALDRCASWYHALSPEQLQRLQFAHMLLLKPQLVVMDEALSSLDKKSYESLYNLLGEFLPEGATVVTISHDASVYAPLHDKHLTIQGEDGAKRLVPAKRFMK